MPKKTPLTKIVLTEFHGAGFVEVYDLFKDRICCTRGSIRSVYLMGDEVEFIRRGRCATLWIAHEDDSGFEMIINHGRLRKDTTPTWNLELLREKRNASMIAFGNKHHSERERIGGGKETKEDRRPDPRRNDPRD